jgi:hypothetical protein
MYNFRTGDGKLTSLSPESNMLGTANLFSILHIADIIVAVFSV